MDNLLEFMSDWKYGNVILYGRIIMFDAEYSTASRSVPIRTVDYTTGDRPWKKRSTSRIYESERIGRFIQYTSKTVAFYPNKQARLEFVSLAYKLKINKLIQGSGWQIERNDWVHEND